MDKLEKYSELIKKLMTTHVEISEQSNISYPETQVIFDDQSHRYMLCRVGWFKRKRIRGITLYVRLHEGKIWIEEDWTEDGIATDLLEANVPKEDIVLAFHHPEIRPYTEFAVA